MSFNPETRTDPTVTRRIRFSVRSVGFIFELPVPVYINEALSDADWQQAMQETADHAPGLLLQAAAAGYLGDGAREYVAPVLERILHDRIYARFSALQRARGNDAWEVPRGMSQSLIEIPGVPLWR